MFFIHHIYHKQESEVTDLRWKFLLTGREKSKISPHTILGNTTSKDDDGVVVIIIVTVVIIDMSIYNFKSLHLGVGCGLVGLLLTLVTSALVLRF